MRIRRLRRTAATTALALALAASAVAASAENAAAPVLDAPVAPLRAADLFDPPPRPWLAGHRGIDLLTTVGAPVLSPGQGTVAFVGRVVDRGVITIDHGALRSSVEPVDAVLTVGTAVRAGEQVGVVGAEPGHCAPAACVHWGVREGDVYVDPLDVLRGFGPVILLPAG